MVSVMVGDLSSGDERVKYGHSHHDAESVGVVGTTSCVNLIYIYMYMCIFF